MTPSPRSTLPNSSNYYWSQAIIHDAMGQDTWATMYLFLYYMSSSGE
jgi:hypothetical protein